MALSIEDDETDQLAHQLAEMTGKSITDVVRDALRHHLDSLDRDRDREAYKSRLLALGREVAAEMTSPFHSSDHADLLYGPDGLPK